ncbi:unnamed protein product [Oncorhynchus mykiss]|uniref:Uncharacterized protein n=1 Tax=Oncorhynchus mykiss TaxID=8022 RepID=A0A060W1J0_ONCMY|nr:unnamed protein product [Oncorhynchus mykiss]
MYDLSRQNVFFPENHSSTVLRRFKSCSAPYVLTHTHTHNPLLPHSSGYHSPLKFDPFPGSEFLRQSNLSVSLFLRFCLERNYEPSLLCTSKERERDLKIAVQQRSPSHLTELERLCRKEWEKLPKYRRAKLVASYPRRLEAVIAAKGASTKYCVNGLNTYINLISFFLQNV